MALIERILRPGRIIGMVLGLLAVTGIAGPAAADPAAGTAPAAGSGQASARWRHDQSTCTWLQAKRALATEQRRVLELVGSAQILRSQADLDRLAVPNPATGTVYSLLPHLFDSMQGMGFTVVNVGAGGPGKPPLLLYRPNPHAADFLDPNGADFPYVLAGWGYVFPYTPGVAPALPADPGLKCLSANQWLVHERSVHPSDTWQNIAVPPVEQFRGQVAGDVPPTAAECQCPVGLNHGRFWDIHFWLNDTPVPTVSEFNPGRRLLPGFPTGIGFFYPEQP